MNTNPDETRLARWLDDELHGEELASFEVWVKDHPEHFAAREEIRKWRELVASAIPADEEPPYADFFNSRVMRQIRESQVAVPEDPRPGRFSWRSLVMPMAACAGMLVAFQLGVRMQGGPAARMAGTPDPAPPVAPVLAAAAPLDPVIYVPQKGVKAEWFNSEDASATVIVINGVDAIPDTTDFSETVMLKTVREIDSTAWLESRPELLKDL